MKKTKTQKGITLIALIITIVVLLILAVVAIRAVQGDGIIAHAKNATNTYNEKQNEEETLLGDFDDYITLQTAKPSEGLEFGSNGDGTCGLEGLGTCTDDVIVVPSTYNGQIITSIGGNYTCGRNKPVTKLILPDTINHIRDSAFYDVEAWNEIKEVSINCKKIEYVGFDAFANPGLYNNSNNFEEGVYIIENIISYCAEKPTQISGEEYTVRNGIRALGTYSFNQVQVTKFNLPTSIEWIGSQVFGENARTINYAGTKEEWNNITKDEDWDSGNNNIVIQCKDGTI